MLPLALTYPESFHMSLLAVDAKFHVFALYVDGCGSEPLGSILNGMPPAGEAGIVVSLETVQLLKLDAKLAHAYMSRGSGNTFVTLSTTTKLTLEFAVIVILADELPIAIADVFTT
jgi:hypothetical protein